MIEPGIIIFLIGCLLALAPPIEKAIAQRRWHRTDMVIPPPVAEAIPFARPAPDLDALAAAADEALEHDALSRGVRRVARTYARAAIRRHP